MILGSHIPMNFPCIGWDRLPVADYLKDFQRLSTPLLEQIEEHGFVTEQGYSPGAGEKNGYMGGQADLTPLKNKAREAVEALNDAQKAADAGRAEDAMEAMRRARAAIDAALGGAISPHGAATPSAGNSGPGRY